MAAKTEEHHTAVETPNPPVRVPAEHRTAAEAPDPPVTITEEYHTAVEAPDPPVRVPAEHHTASAADSEKRKEREEEEEEIGSKRRKCQLALDKESARSNRSFSFDTRCVVPIETTPKFGSFNSSAADPTVVVDSGEKMSGEEEKSGAHSEGKDGI